MQVFTAYKPWSMAKYARRIAPAAGDQCPSFSEGNLVQEDHATEDVLRSLKRTFGIFSNEPRPINLEEVLQTQSSIFKTSQSSRGGGDVPLRTLINSSICDCVNFSYIDDLLVLNFNFINSSFLRQGISQFQIPVTISF